jgi:uncharacterized membrane protein
MVFVPMKKLILGIAGAAALSACGMPTPTDPELACDAAPASATLATNVQAVFTAKCATCHIKDYSYGDYTTAEKTAAATVSKKSLYAGQAATLQIVQPSSLANSSLWLKVLGGATTGRTGPKGENVYGKMPNDNTTLTADEKKILKDWICSGAK